MQEKKTSPLLDNLHPNREESDILLKTINIYMRIAICLSGLIRSKVHCINTIDKIKETSTETRIFVHSQRLTNRDSSSIWLGSALSNSFVTNYLEPESILDVVQPDSYLFEHYEADVMPLCDSLTDIMYCDQYGKENTSKTYSMYYSIYKANELKKQWESKNNIKFDIVYRIRSDLELFNDHYLPCEAVQTNTLFIAATGDAHGGVDDQFAFGDSSTMDLYSSCFLNIKNIKEKIGPSNPWNSEIMLKHYIEKCCKLNIQLSKVSSKVNRE